MNLPTERKTFSFSPRIYATHVTLLFQIFGVLKFYFHGSGFNPEFESDGPTPTYCEVLEKTYKAVSEIVLKNSVLKMY